MKNVLIGGAVIAAAAALWALYQHSKTTTAPAAVVPRPGPSVGGIDLNGAVKTVGAVAQLGSGIVSQLNN